MVDTIGAAAVPEEMNCPPVNSRAESFVTERLFPDRKVQADRLGTAWLGGMLICGGIVIVFTSYCVCGDTDRAREVWGALIIDWCSKGDDCSRHM